MGSDSFLAKRNHHVIKQILVRFSKKFGVRIYQQAINSNHVHLVLRITNRTLSAGFIKAVSGQITSHTVRQQSFRVFALARLQKAAGDGSKTLQQSQAGGGTAGISTAGLSNEMAKHQKPEGFWQFRPFSRVISWGRDFKSCISYLKQNTLEAFDFMNYKLRRNYYSAWIKSAARVFETG